MYILGSQNSAEDRDRRANFTSRNELDHEAEFQNNQDNNYWEREHEQQVREPRSKN